jgi:pyridoxamine 5'-phosphate oxidase-like protein
MTSWADLEAADPELAATGRRLLTRSGIGEGLLATIRPGEPPRIHPVYAEIVDGRLLTFVQPGSAKARDLEADPRYALHTHVDPAAPDEFLVRGRARRIDDPDVLAAAHAAWAFDGTGYPLYELQLEHVLLGRRATAEDWPPVYTAWRPAGSASGG